MRLGGRHGERLYRELLRAADAYQRDREREAVRLLEPVRDALPKSPSVRELLGLALYHQGRFGSAAKEFEVFVELTGDVDQHPVLMDCYRALRRYRRVGELWAQLGESSPSAELVTEGRIVLAGSLADRGRVGEAVELLRRRSTGAKRIREHHLRLWYALGDLEERAGNLPGARALFEQVRLHEPGFADVGERLAALG
jgi:tetratricopeptide (TPR) repeat protein